MDMDMDKTNNVNISAIDRALAAAKARKAAKEEFSDADAAPMLRKAVKSMIKPDAAEKAAVKALKDAQKANKKAERDAERARRKMEKSTVQAVKKTSHMKWSKQLSFLNYSDTNKRLNSTNASYKKCADSLPHHRQDAAQQIQEFSFQRRTPLSL